MKTLTALSIAAALAMGMGMSAASAQSSMTKKPTVTGSSQYCSKSHMGTLNCKFTSMASCEKAVGPLKGQSVGRTTCVRNPRLAASGKMNSSTTGAGMKEK